MATAVAAISEAIPQLNFNPVKPALNSLPPSISKFELKQGWEDYRKNTEPKGLAFGKLCYDFRAGAEVVQGGTTFRDTLAELGIPKSTAYYWIERYEILIGIKQPEAKTTEPEVETFSGWKPNSAESEIEDIVPANWSPAKPVASVTVTDELHTPPVLQEAKPRVIKLIQGMLVEFESNFYRVSQTKKNQAPILIWADPRTTSNDTLSCLHHLERTSSPMGEGEESSDRASP